MQQDIWKDRNFEPFTPSQETGKAPRLSSLQGLLIGIGLGALLTLGATRLISPSPRTPSQPAAEPTQPPNKVAVTVAPVQPNQVNRTLKATGTVAAVEMIPVLSQTNGLQIQQILVDEGDYVSAGQLLVRLDDAIGQAQLAQAQATIAQAQARLAELEAGNRVEEIERAKANVKRIQAEILQAQSDWDLAKKRVERNQTLETEGAIAQDRLDEVLNEERSKRALVEQAQARLREAQARLEELQAGPRPEIKAQAGAQLAEAKGRLQLVRAQLKETLVTAPVSGKIVRRNAKIGDVTDSRTPLFEIIEAGRLELQLQVPESQLRTIRPGQEVKISSNADSRLSLAGRVKEIYPTVDANSRQGMIKVSLASAAGLKPGMFLQAAITTQTATSPTIPMPAVLPQADGSAMVYVVQADNTVKARGIKIGEIMGNQKVEILEGLELGERVVVKGAAYLKDGDAVLAREP